MKLSLFTLACFNIFLVVKSNYPQNLGSARQGLHLLLLMDQSKHKLNGTEKFVGSAVSIHRYYAITTDEVFNKAEMSDLRVINAASKVDMRTVSSTIHVIESETIGELVLLHMSSKTWGDIWMGTSMQFYYPKTLDLEPCRCTIWKESGDYLEKVVLPLQGNRTTIITSGLQMLPTDGVWNVNPCGHSKAINMGAGIECAVSVVALLDGFIIKGESVKCKAGTPAEVGLNANGPAKLVGYTISSAHETVVLKEINNIEMVDEFDDDFIDRPPKIHFIEEEVHYWGVCPSTASIPIFSFPFYYFILWLFSFNLIY